jgi:small-conductance mechanosensitive channel
LEAIAKLAYYVILIVGILSILPIVGVEPSGLLVAGGIVGLAVGFASQTVVSNLLSGLLLMIERPILIGSPVDIEGTGGFVEDIRVISTTIRTWDGLSVRGPNGRVFTSTITNYNAYAARRFEYSIGIRYSDDADKALEIINRLIEEHPLALKQPAPQVFVDSLGDNSVNIIARIWGPISDWFTVKIELLWKIKKALEEEGIEIPFPQRVVWFGNQPPGGKECKEAKAN